MLFYTMAPLTVRKEVDSGRWGPIEKYRHVFLLFWPNFTPIREKTRLLKIPHEKCMFLPPGEDDNMLPVGLSVSKKINMLSSNQSGTFPQSVLFLQIGENSLNRENFYQFFADFDPRSRDFLGIAHPAEYRKFLHFETCPKIWQREKEGKFPRVAEIFIA